MSFEYVVKKASEHGSSVGQTSLSEYLIREYGNEMSRHMKVFLEKVAQHGYKNIGENVGTPAEDVALEVSKIMDKKLS